MTKLELKLKSLIDNPGLPVFSTPYEFMIWLRHELLKDKDNE